VAPYIFILVTLPHGLDVYRSEVFRYTSLDLAPGPLLAGAEEEIADIDALSVVLNWPALLTQ
jgi:hypothetical protein